MDIILAPITVHIHLSNQLIPRIVVYLFSLYFTAAWVFPHAISFMLATVFTRQYKLLSRSLERMLADSDERRLSDSDIETFRQRHNEISTLVCETDDFLMFHNSGAFCCQLFDSILHFYDLIFSTVTQTTLLSSRCVCSRCSVSRLDSPLPQLLESCLTIT